MQPLYTTENRFEANKKTLTFYGKGLVFSTINGDLFEKLERCL